MLDIAFLIRVEGDVEVVYRRVATLAGIAAWFTRASAEEYAPGHILTLHFPEGSTRFDVTTMTSNSEIVWRCISDEGIWAQTEIRFAFERCESKTIVRFDHSGWSEATDIYRDCGMSWAYFLESLRLLVETGRGTPEAVAPPCELET